MVSFKQIPGEVTAFANIAYNAMCLLMFLLTMARSFSSQGALFFGLLSIVAIVKMIRNIFKFIRLLKEQEVTSV